MRDTAFRLFNRTAQRASNLLFRGVLGTEPARAGTNTGAVLYTPIGRKSCRAYILGAKSLLRFHRGFQVAIQDDGSLTERQVEELRQHLPGCAVFTREDMESIINERVSTDLLESLPPLDRCHVLVRLKLLNVIARFPGRRVMMFDSDMLCLRPPDYIVKWASGAATCDFYSGGGSLLAATFHEIGFSFGDIDIRNFNSGLVGFDNTFGQEQVAGVVRRIRAFDERLFRNWEIEQAIWAVLFAMRGNAVNIDGLATLYVGGAWRPYRELRDLAIVAHFVGAARFRNLSYLRLARRVIRELKAQSAAS